MDESDTWSKLGGFFKLAQGGPSPTIKPTRTSGWFLGRRRRRRASAKPCMSFYTTFSSMNTSYSMPQI